MRTKSSFLSVTAILGILVAFVFLQLPTPANALPCVAESLANYVTLGHSGCQIGDKIFHDFRYSPTSYGGGVPVPASGIGVVPIDLPLLAEIDFNGLFAAGPYQGVDGVIRFTVGVLPGGNLIDDLGLTQGGSVVYGTGIAGVGEDACAGGLLTGGCVGGVPLHLQTVVAFGGGLSITSAHVNFSPVSTIDVIKDIGVTGGQYGLALLSHVTNEFSEAPGGGGGGEVPEPGTWVLMGSGFLGLFGIARKRLALR